MTEKNLFQKFLKISVYPVTCEEFSLGRSDEEVVCQVLQGGAAIVQYRNKNRNFQDHLSVLKRIRLQTKRYGALLIVNDSVDLARLVEADGVHLGQEDTPCREARCMLGSQFIIGISCHNLQEALQAKRDGATYINIGPIFQTKTKKNCTQAVGLNLIKKVADSIDIPMTVMGGISFQNIESVLAQGVRRIAMVTALTSAKNIAMETKKYIEMIKKYSSS